MNPLKRAWQRGEIVEYRERGAEGSFWFLDPPEWDEARYEYREYHPLPPPAPVLNDAQQQAVNLANLQVAQMRLRQQREADGLAFTRRAEDNAEYVPPMPKWLAWGLALVFIVVLTAASWLLGEWVVPR
jgi:hypothetical protein